MKKILTILIIFSIFIWFRSSVQALDPGPKIDSGLDYAVGANSKTNGSKTANKIIKFLFGGSTFTITNPNSTITPTPGNTGGPYPSTSPTSSQPEPSETISITPDPNNIPTALDPNQNYPATYIANAQNCLKNKSIYQTAQAATGVPWQILGGIHMAEGSCRSTASCVSGRTIGTNEPDVRGNCSNSNSGIGFPNPLPGGGCGFANLLDSCVYGAKHLIGKIGKVPTTVPDLAKALGRYNGTGNANCGRTPYKNCPPKYEGYDHIYPFNKYDSEHQLMYLVYCADYTKCNPPVIRDKVGVFVIAAILYRY